ncbi:hypothetical protein A5699_27840 [Mycobacterium sp. E802]|nr:hypothetical protein A5699_27840 [Mycobacterium sp. E802]
MANDLEVDADGLRSAAFGSDLTAEALAGTCLGGPSASQPSSAGVAAVNAALFRVQARQSRRMTGQADDLSVAGARYDTEDAASAAAIATVSV